MWRSAHRRLEVESGAEGESAQVTEKAEEQCIAQEIRWGIHLDRLQAIYYREQEERPKAENNKNKEGYTTWKRISEAVVQQKHKVTRGNDRTRSEPIERMKVKGSEQDKMMNGD